MSKEEKQIDEQIKKRICPVCEKTRIGEHPYLCESCAEDYLKDILKKRKEYWLNQHKT